MPLLPPHRHTRTFVRAYTRPLPRVTRVSALAVVVVVVVDDGVWQSVDATAPLDGGPPTIFSLPMDHDPTTSGGLPTTLTRR